VPLYVNDEDLFARFTNMDVIHALLTIKAVWTSRAQWSGTVCR
jgi:hypothetical protein